MIASASQRSMAADTSPGVAVPDPETDLAFITPD